MIHAIVVLLDATPATPDLATRVAEAVRRVVPSVPLADGPDPAGRLGRPPFGFRRRAGHLLPDVREAPVLRDLFAAVDADPAASHADLARHLVRAHPWLATQWSRPKDRPRRLVSLLELRPRLEPLLASPAPRSGAGASGDPQAN